MVTATGAGEAPVHRAWLLPLAVFLIVLAGGQAAVGMRAAATASVTGDEPFYLLTTQSLVSDGDLDLRDEYRQREYRRFWDGNIPLWKQMEPAPDGRLLSPHEPGLSVITTPAYAAFGLRGVQRFLVVLWALAMAGAAVVARRYGAPGGAAGFAAAVVGLSPPGIVYGSQVYPEGAAALAVAVALLAVTSNRARPILVSAAMIGLAWLGIKYGAVGVALAGAWAWRFRNQPRLLAIAAALCAMAGAHYVWWHLDTFGGLTPYGTNVVWAGEGTAAIVDSHVRVQGRLYRLYGLFLDARFGLLGWLPITALALWGVARRTVLPSGIVAVAVAVGTFVSITMMGWWFPGRMLVAVLPAVVVLVALGVQRYPRIGLGLGVWSLAIGVAVVVAARTGGIRLAVDPFAVGFPRPPHWWFPDFREFRTPEVAMSVAWGVALAGLRWVHPARAKRRDTG